MWTCVLCSGVVLKLTIMDYIKCIGMCKRNLLIVLRNVYMCAQTIYIEAIEAWGHCSKPFLHHTKVATMATLLCLVFGFQALELFSVPF